MLNNKETQLRDFLSLCSEITKVYGKHLNHLSNDELEFWDYFIDEVYSLNKGHTCPKCGSSAWCWANIGLTDAKQCTDCGEIFFSGSAGKPWVKPWREITKGQIDDCLKHSDNYDFAWAIEAVCKRNNGY